MMPIQFDSRLMLALKRLLLNIEFAHINAIKIHNIENYYRKNTSVFEIRYLAFLDLMCRDLFLNQLRDFPPGTFPRTRVSVV